MTTIENITADMNWRYGELASLKTIPYRYHMQECHVSMLKKYLIPAMYAIWEGFISNTILAYISEINNIGLMPEKIGANVLAYMAEADEHLRLSIARTDRVKQERYYEELKSMMSQPVKIKHYVITKSNVNLKVANDLLCSFSLAPLPIKYERGLNKLLCFRNAIAHGNNAILVTDEVISEFSMLISDLMSEIVVRVEEGLKRQSFIC